MFDATKMWIDTLLNMFTSEVSSIPRDIGNDMLVTSSMLVTRAGVRLFIIPEEWSDEVDRGFCSSLVDFVKSNVDNVEVSVKFVTKRTRVDLRDPTIESNIMLWERYLSKKIKNEARVRRVSRLLMAVEELKTGVNTYNVQTIIEVRGKSYRNAYRAFKSVCQYLDSTGTDYWKINNSLSQYLPFIMKTFVSKTKVADEVPRCLFTTKTLSHSMGIIQGVNAENGLLLGMDVLNKSPYYIDDSGRGAKNIFLYGNSGSGKTVTAIMMCVSAILNGRNLTISDVKGNEFTGLTKAFGGEIVSLRVTDDTFINVFKLDESKAKDKEYYRKMCLYQKKFLTTVINAPLSEEDNANAFVAEFLNSINIQEAITENPSTWRKSRNIRVKELYERVCNFISDDVERAFGTSLITRVKNQFKSHFSSKGDLSYLYDVELDYSTVIDNSLICFDFGLLKSARVKYEAVINLKFFMHDIINDDFIARKFEQDRDNKTLIVEEESQIVPERVIETYKENFTIRRAQGCNNLLLGNSIGALKNRVAGQAIIDNTNILILGKSNPNSVDTLMKEFDLDSDDHVKLKSICNDKTENHYFLVKDFSKKSIKTIVDVKIPEDVMTNSDLFRAINSTDFEDEEAI